MNNEILLSIQLKKDLAKEYKFNRPAYTKAKGTFIQEIIKKAKEEQLL